MVPSSDSFVSSNRAVDSLIRGVATVRASYLVLHLSTLVMPITDVERVVFLAYFISHVPATALIDSQVVLPSRLVPKFAKSALAWHIRQNNDVLMSTQPRWLVSLVTCELVFQFPFFFYAISALRRRDEGARGWLIAYGAHTATTMAPILQFIHDSAKLTARERWSLMGIYAPYLIVPLWIAMRALG